MSKAYDLESLKVVLARHSRVSDAAREIGMKPDAVYDTFRKRELSAASFLAKGHVRVPEGHEVKSVTTLEDGDGNLLQSSTKTQQAAGEPRFQPLPPDHTIKGLTTALGPGGDIRWQWVMARKDEAQRWEQFHAAMATATERYRSCAEAVVAPVNPIADMLTIYPLGDPHIGMLAWHRETGADFDVRIAERELFGVVDMLVERAPPSHDAILANLGDFLHAQSDKNLTPNGSNKLDVDGRIAKVNEIAFALMRRLIDKVRQKHTNVRVITVPGNHDPDTARMLAIYLRAVYEGEPRVTIEPNWNPYTYVEWGKNLIGFAHGDGAKFERLPEIMATDQAAAWGRATHRYWHTGHVHHISRKETPGCVCESHRTLAANDGWHHWKGYRSGKSLSAITYTADGGEISRQTVDLSVARSRIAASVRNAGT